LIDVESGGNLKKLVKRKGKRIAITVVFIVALIVVVGFYLISRTGEINLGLEDNGRILDVSAGVIVVIKLPENPSTGYRWQYTVNENIAEVIEDIYTDPDPPIIGGTGTRMLKLKVIGSGEFTMNYAQPWENQPIGYFSVTFRV